MFVVDREVQGDVLIRCRHLNESGEASTLFRFMFHTAFITDGLLRLGKAELDGACTDPKLADDCWVDVCFTHLCSAPWDFWKSFQHSKPVLAKKAVRPPSEPGTEEEEEEKIDSETLEKYRSALDDSPQQDDDLSQYMKELEAKGFKVE